MNLKSKIREKIARRLGVPEIKFGLERLARLSFNPGLIFDVGAYQGEFAKLCLSVWPQTRVACFEPQEQGVIELQKLARHKPSVTIFPILVGANTPQEKVGLHECRTASSILSEYVPQDFPLKFYSMRAIDDIIQQDFNSQSPDLLKIDVQGYELEVLKGAEKALTSIQVVLIEVNLLDIYKDVPLFHEITQWFANRGWVAYDICGITRRPLDQALWEADFIFVPNQSPLRTDKHWK